MVAPAMTVDDLLHVIPSVSLQSASGNAPARLSSSALPPWRRIVRQARIVLSFGSTGSGASDEQPRATDVEKRKTVVAQRMKEALNLADWNAAAEELDLLEGNDAWRRDATTSHGMYDPSLIQTRLAQLNEACATGDVEAMLHIVRTSLSRDLGGMRNANLYQHSYIGTKHLIEQYVEAAVRVIDTLVNLTASDEALPPELSQNQLLETLLYARQSFGSSALLLSGGGTLGMMHIGVVKAMFDAKMLPRILSGSSAGSIVCSVLCSKTDAEIPDLLSNFPYGDLAVFEPSDAEESFSARLGRLLTDGCWLDIKHLTRVMRAMLGEITFQEAYNRTRRICNIAVSTESIYELPTLLNHITAPNVLMWSAVAASCSVPLVFSAAPLLVKDPITGDHVPWNPTPQRWVDGSVDNDLPMTRLSEMFNVNHFIVSQVNPHIVFFLPNQVKTPPPEDRPANDQLRDRTWLNTIMSLAKDELLHRFHFMAELGVLPNLSTKLWSVLSQKYSGDINILPAYSVHDIPNILSNPSVEYMKRALLTGERATWPKLSQIKDRCAIELALDRAALNVRARVVFSDSQNDLVRLGVKPEELGGFSGDDRSEVYDPDGMGPLHGFSARMYRAAGRRSSSSAIVPISTPLAEVDPWLDNDATPRYQSQGCIMPSPPKRATVPTRPKLRRASSSQVELSTSSLIPKISIGMPAHSALSKSQRYDSSLRLDFYGNRLAMLSPSTVGFDTSEAHTSDYDDGEERGGPFGSEDSISDVDIGGDGDDHLWRKEVSDAPV